MENRGQNKIALLLYATLLIGEIILGFIYRMNPVLYTNGLNVIVFTSCFNLICFIILVLLFKKYKGNIHFSDIGFSRKGLRKSILLGTCLFLVMFVWRVMTGIISFPITGITLFELFYQAIYQFIFIVLFEELIFRAVIGKQFFVYNKIVSTVIVGLLFASLHIPFQVMIGHFSLTVQLSKTIVYVCFHVLLQFLYDRYDSIAAPVLFHFAVNYLSWLSN